MKLEELRMEAERHGYVLTKKPKKRPYVKFKSCPGCGSNRHSYWHVIEGHGACFYQCNKCGFRGGNGSSERKARIAWNEAVEKVTKEDGSNE